MKIRIASDLHIEICPYFDFPQLPEDKDTILILAGDIFRADKAWSVRGVIKNTSDDFGKVLYVPGNHDHWGGSIVRTRAKIERAMGGELPTNFHMLDNQTTVIDDVAFIGSTLWTDYGKEDTFMMNKAEKGGMSGRALMNDFNKIRWGDERLPYKRKLRPVHTVALHFRAKEFIFTEIAKHKKLGRKTVVITHHAPSIQSMEDTFKTDDMYGAYASELGWRIMDEGPDVWIHGHVHCSNDYMIHNTRVISNPRGYEGFKHGYNHSFNPEFILEI